MIISFTLRRTSDCRMSTCVLAPVPVHCGVLAIRVSVG